MCVMFYISGVEPGYNLDADDNMGGCACYSVAGTEKKIVIYI